MGDLRRREGNERQDMHGPTGTTPGELAARSLCFARVRAFPALLGCYNQLMAARCLARFILDRRRDLISDRPNCTSAAEAPLDEAQERYHFDNPTAHTHGAYQHSKAA